MASPLQFAPLFHDHAVLQHGMSLPIWGTARPLAVVTVELAGRRARVAAGGDGAWLLRLPPLPPGGPHELVAQADGDTVVARDVLLGEVWLCSGQSNMGMSLVRTAQDVAADGDQPQIRLLTVRTAAVLGGQRAIDGTWAPATAAARAEFSAVAWWFGRSLHRALGMPVGLICNAWGGTRIQAWMSREALMRDPLGREEVARHDREMFVADGQPSDAAVAFAEWERNGPHQDAGNRGLAEGWAVPGFADQAWDLMPLPRRWQDHGHPGSGVVWFRRTVDLPAGWAGRDLELHLGAIDKHDDTWVGGERVGGLSWADGPDTWKTPRSYHVPARLAAGGTLTIAVRARSHFNHGGMTGPVEVMRVHPTDAPQDTVALCGPWRYRFEQDWGVQVPPAAPWGPGNANTPHILFDCRVAPLIPYAIRGVIWYQGESNTSQPAVYRRLLPAMVRDWRRAWGQRQEQGELPFIQVQLANHYPPPLAGHPVHSRWAELREAQAALLDAEPATGLAVAIDVGEALDIHPRDKRPVGERLARWALATTYGRGGAPGGPRFAGMTVESGQVRCRFTGQDSLCSLRTRDGAPPAFVDVAGADRRFMRADARIDDGTLVAWSPQVPQPVAVRYAWADNPQGCNLVDGEDLPVVPFRSDNW